MSERCPSCVPTYTLIASKCSPAPPSGSKGLLRELIAVEAALPGSFEWTVHLGETQQVASRGVKDLPAEIAGERIDLAAIQAPDGRIFSGVTHLDATDAAVRAGVTTEILARCGEGFITTSDRYVNRVEAQSMSLS